MFPYYVHLFNDSGCLLSTEPAKSIEEARHLVAEMVPTLEPGDTIKIEENE